MRFRDFLLKHLLVDSDYLVGYNANGDYIRISKADLAASVASAATSTAPTLTAQYSANGDSWHDSYASGDKYIRIKAGSGSWSGAVRISVSAYDIWLQQGNSGDEAAFLASLKGEDGESADLSGLELSEISGYDAFLRQVNAAITNAKNDIIRDVVSSSLGQVMAQFTGLQLSDITEVRSLSDDDYLTIVTSDGLRKVKIGSLSDNVAVRTVSTKVIESSIVRQLEIIGVTGDKNGTNKVYITNKNYVSGTSMVFVNGQRFTPGTDYKETAGGFEFAEFAPIATDDILFQAVPK